MLRRTLVDAVRVHGQLNAALQRRPVDVLQLLHSFLAHVLQLAHVVVNIGDLHLASCPRTPSCHLEGRKQGLGCVADMRNLEFTDWGLWREIE